MTSAPFVFSYSPPVVTSLTGSITTIGYSELQIGALFSAVQFTESRSFGFAAGQNFGSFTGTGPNVPSWVHVVVHTSAGDRSCRIVRFPTLQMP